MKKILIILLFLTQIAGAQTIADKLTNLNEAKINIRDAIASQGIDMTGVPFTNYHISIAEIEGGGGASASLYIRPDDWLELPEVLETDQKMVALFAVHEAQKNIVAFTASGAYTVDWGDGVVEDFAAGAVASHNYDYTDLAPETWSSRGYRQAILTITPQAGHNITSFGLSLYPATPRPNFPSYNFLDIVLSFPQCATFTLGYGLAGTGAGQHVLKMLESFEMKSPFLSVSTFANLFRDQLSLRQAILKNNGSVTAMNNTFRDCNSLTSVPLFDTSSVTNMGFMFHNCHALTSVPLFDTSEVTTMQSTFNSCYSLASVPLFDTSSVTNMSHMFNFCYSLTSAPLFNTPIVTNMTNMFQNCYALKRLQAPITRSTTLANASMEYEALVETITALVPFADQTLTITGNPGADAVMAAIADSTITVPTGWTIAN